MQFTMFQRHAIFILFSNKLRLHHSETSHPFDTLLCGFQNMFISISELDHCFYFVWYLDWTEPVLWYWKVWRSSCGSLGCTYKIKSKKQKYNIKYWMSKWTIKKAGRNKDLTLVIIPFQITHFPFYTSRKKRLVFWCF